MGKNAKYFSFFGREDYTIAGMTGVYTYSEGHCQTGLHFGKMYDPKYYPSSPTVLQSMLKGKLGRGKYKRHDSRQEHSRKGSKIDQREKQDKTNLRTAKSTVHVSKSVQNSSVLTGTAQNPPARAPDIIASKGSHKAQDRTGSSLKRRSIRKWLQGLRIPVDPIGTEPTKIFPLRNGTTVSHLVRR